MVTVSYSSWSSKVTLADAEGQRELHHCCWGRDEVAEAATVLRRTTRDWSCLVQSHHRMAALLPTASPDCNHRHKTQLYTLLSNRSHPPKLYYYYFFLNSPLAQSRRHDNIVVREMCNGCKGVSLGDHGVPEGNRIPSLKSHGKASMCDGCLQRSAGSVVGQATCSKGGLDIASNLGLKGDRKARWAGVSSGSLATCPNSEL